MDKKQTFWKMWKEELPGSFPKSQLVDELSGRWGIAKSNVYARLESERFMSLTSDLSFMHENYGIGFDFKDRGFFLDQRQYEIIKQNEDLEAAKMFGMLK